jgi:very-short-patch-repair endonuclease/RecA/RadA recombinase
MYAASIRRLLELYPAGVSQEQLLWRLKVAGVRATGVDVLQSLNELSTNGEIRIVAHGRWALSRFLELKQEHSPEIQVINGDRPTVLRAAFGKVERIEPIEAGGQFSYSDGNSWRFQDYWRQILSYYAATQKADPRGRITQFADRHGAQWQLVAVGGEWWQNARLTFELSTLAEGFREALMRRSERTCAIGYPLTVVATTAGDEFLPGLLLPARWEVQDEQLVVELWTDPPVLNPDWLKRIAARTTWKADSLQEALFPAGEESGLDSVARRLRNALARFGGGGLVVGKLDDRVSVGKEGIRNAAAIFLSSDSTYTQGAARDLELIANVAESEWRSTALSQLFADEVNLPKYAPPIDVVQLRDMTDSQFRAASSLLNAAISMVQGPPGTGKSDIVVSVIMSALVAGKSVLFASRNHQALDEVESRLKEVSGEAPVLTRARDAEGGRDTDFLSELKALAAAEPQSSGPPPSTPSILQKAVAASRAKSVRLARSDVELKLAEALERLNAVAPQESSTTINAPPTRPSFFLRLRDWFWRLLRRTDAKPAFKTTSEALQHDASVDEIRSYINLLRNESDRLVAALGEISLEDVPAIAKPEDRAALQMLFQHQTKLAPGDRQALIERVKELEFSGATKAKDLQPGDATLLLKHRPIWAVSTLSVPSRIPLIPALFDLLIIDEASQCDIASSLPLFYRARQAAIVGDPLQLSFVPQLSLRQEHALMDAAGVPKTGRWRIAQSRTSLFDFVSMRPSRSEHFLADQFRSAPAIIDYLNDRFYQGRLVCRKDDDDLLKVPDYKSGLAWVDVKGRTTRIDDENVNEAEAAEVVRRVAALAQDDSFEGSIGILSPFNGQVSLIRRQLDDALRQAGRSLSEIKVATIDKFQGGEADVVFFSPVISDGAGFGATTFIRREHRRINVAVSRARSVCVIVGNLAFARSSDIQHLRSLARFATEPFSPPRPPFDSLWERKLCQAMKQRGLEPKSQYAVGRRYLDFALFKGAVKLDVEVDGRAFHTDRDGNRKISDLLRDAEMKGRGWKVRRFWVSELDRNMEKCLDLIVADLD